MLEMEMVSRIANIVIPPSAVALSSSRKLHPALGPPIELPNDYLEFLQVFGTGCFSDSRFKLCVLNITHRPSISFTAETLFSAARDYGHHILGQTYEAYPSAPGILPWGCDDQGLSLNWLVDGPPGTWKTVVGRIDYVVYDYGMAQLIHNCVSGSIPFYSDGIFGPDIAFTSC
ncbi:hypothetical protein [Novipirellula rosea]|uniref:Uncharacterized protein n=1 Tax=Novipirellula rosea TaxID=1031540 RepID=A0ABP8MD15_9BACT